MIEFIQCNPEARYEDLLNKVQVIIYMYLRPYVPTGTRRDDDDENLLIENDEKD